jgi:chromosome segregation ATPase
LLFENHQQQVLNLKSTIEEVKRAYESQIVDMKRSFAQKLDATEKRLTAAHQKEIQLLLTTQQTKSLGDKARLEATEKQIRKEYENKIKEAVQAVEVAQQTFQKQLAEHRSVLHSAQTKISSLHAALESSRKLSIKDIESKDNVISKLEGVLKEAEHQRHLDERCLEDAQEVAALVIYMNRNSRLRTTDDYDSNELYAYLYHSAPDKSSAKRFKKQMQAGERGAGRQTESGEAIVQATHLAQAYSVSKVYSCLPLLHSVLVPHVCVFVCSAHY